MFVVLAALVVLSAPALAARVMDVQIVSDDAGQKLQLGGEDYMVLGMNWGYMPIGENYMYNLWEKPEPFIKAVVDREMGLLADMGVNSIRQYAGIPPEWVEYIYVNYSINTIINHTMARYA